MKIEEIEFTTSLQRQEIFDVLKTEAKNIHITDIMAASAHLKEDSKYVQPHYREKYTRVYIESFLMRIKEINDNKNHYEGTVEADELLEVLNLMQKQQKLAELDYDQHINFFKIYRLIALYTTFILKEPIHPVGMPFPGGLNIEYEKGTYYCPVKESQKDNPGAVCGFCIAEQTKNI